eukprot:scaffold531962_cov40-Prasinocladus_malaysianus.AAC.1
MGHQHHHHMLQLDMRQQCSLGVDDDGNSVVANDPSMCCPLSLSTRDCLIITSDCRRLTHCVCRPLAE